MKCRFEVFFNHRTFRSCSFIAVATPLWGTQRLFFLGCRQKRHKLVLFSVWGCVQINCMMIGCQNGKSCKLSMRIWICLCHSTCGAFLETIAGTAKKQSETESRLQSRDCSIVFYQARVVFSSTETTFFDFFNISRGVKELFPVLLH